MRYVKDRLVMRRELYRNSGTSSHVTSGRERKRIEHDESLRAVRSSGKVIELECNFIVRHS